MPTLSGLGVAFGVAPIRPFGQYAGALFVHVSVLTRWYIHIYMCVCVIDTTYTGGGVFVVGVLVLVLLTTGVCVFLLWGGGGETVRQEGWSRYGLCNLSRIFKTSHKSPEQGLNLSRS